MENNEENDRKSKTTDKTNSIDQRTNATVKTISLLNPPFRAFIQLAKV